jgi:hypothetical protein
MSQLLSLKPAVAPSGVFHTKIHISPDLPAFTESKVPQQRIVLFFFRWRVHIIRRFESPILEIYSIEQKVGD